MTPGRRTRSGFTHHVFTAHECKPQWPPCFGGTWVLGPHPEILTQEPNPTCNKVPGREAGRCYLFCRNCRAGPSDFTQNPGGCTQFRILWGFHPSKGHVRPGTQPFLRSLPACPASLGWPGWSWRRANWARLLVWMLACCATSGRSLCPRGHGFFNSKTGMAKWES